MQLTILIQGLEKLEYRGYGYSAGTSLTAAAAISVNG